MAQSKVTSFYTQRRSARNVNNKVSSTEFTKEVANPLVDLNILLKDPKTRKGKNEGKAKEKLKLVETEATEKMVDSVKATQDVKPQKSVKRAPKNTKASSKKGSKATDLPSQTKVTSFYEISKKTSEDDKVSKVPTLSTNVEEIINESVESNLDDIASKKDSQETKQLEVDKDHPLLQSPKRNLTNPGEGTPPKKKPLIDAEKADHLSPTKHIKTPRKLVFPAKEDSASSPLKKENIALKPKVKCRSEETLKAIASVKERIALIKSYETNPYKVTAVISPSEQANEKKSAIPVEPAYQRYSYLAESDASSSLILPKKYKVLSEMFRSMDTVISILNNRKEKITFEKVKEGVQKMLKRNFSTVHLSQIVTVLPSAYSVTLEKCTFKKSNDPDYQLIISPVHKALEGSSNKTKSKGHVIMSPQNLLDRKHQFDYQLLNLVKNHHKVFLSRLNFPELPSESIRKWHPKFPVDSVPDIEGAKLPEIPDTKIFTAKEVFNKMLKGSLRGKQKVVKALKSVAEESTTPIINKKPEEQSKEKLPDTKSALKGVCSDLLAKIRAKESAKLLQSMTETPDEIKRKAMLERLPRIVQILWHYFIAERKAAVPVDTAVEKVIHSFSSLSTHEEVKAHLTLITEKFPGWLSFVQIPKGLYITINRNQNITEMLDNFHC